MRILHATMAIAMIMAISPPARSQGNPAHERIQQAALENLLSERGSPQALNKAIDAARRAGVKEQAILEARFLYHVDLLNDGALAAMLPDFINQQENFDLKDSAIFAVEEDWLAVVEYVKAIAALEKGDRNGFKQHIQEAFWLGPRQAAAFAPQIERLRHEDAMRATTLDFNIELGHLENDQTTRLKSLVSGKKALVLHFWSPLSRECEMSLPDFAKTSEMLAQHQIAVASLTPEASPQAIAMIQPYTQKECGLWAIDSPDHPLGQLLRVQNLPAISVISLDGKVLFSGDPTEPQLWLALQKIDDTIDRPKLNGDYAQ